MNARRIHFEFTRACSNAHSRVNALPGHRPGWLPVWLWTSMAVVLAIDQEIETLIPRDRGNGLGPLEYPS